MNKLSNTSISQTLQTFKIQTPTTQFITLSLSDQQQINIKMMINLYISLKAYKTLISAKHTIKVEYPAVLY